LQDRYLYDIKGNQILDDKDKPILLKYESSKCGGEDCYYVSLSTAQMINVDDEVKLGENSSVFIYQNQTKVLYSTQKGYYNNDTNETIITDTGYNVTVTLLRNSSEGFKTFPEDIWISQNNNELKFGANDTGTTKDERYVYVWDSTIEIFEEDIGNNESKYYIDKRVIPGTFSTTTYKKYFDLSDICNNESNCEYETIKQNVTYGNETREEIRTLKVYFTGFYNSTLNMTFIDPTITDTSFTTTTAAFFNNTNISNGKIQLVNFSQNGTFSRIIELRDYSYNNRTGIVGEWLLDNSLVDSSGNGNNGTFNGGLTACNVLGVDGSGSACDFDGTNDAITIGDNDIFTFGNGTDDSPFTTEFWINTGTCSNAVNVCGVISKDVDSSNREWAFIILEAGNVPRFFLKSQGGANQVHVESSVLLNDNAWHHIALTYDGRGGSTAYNGMNIYVDGVDTSTSRGTSGGAYIAMSNTIADVEIGRYFANRYLDGKMDNVVIYNRNLSVDEIYEDFYADPRSNQFIHNLSVCEWQTKDAVLTMHLDESSPTQIDSSGNGNDGIVQADAKLNTTDCVYNNCYQFDGTGDYISVPDDDSLSFGNGVTDNPFSVSAWIYMNDATKFRIVGKNAGTTLSTEYELAISSVDKLRFSLADSDITLQRIAREYSVALTSLEGEWVHVAGTYNGNGSASGMKVYLNGVRVDDTNQNVGVYTAMHNKASPVGIGKGIADTTDGLIDDVNIYSRALTATEILEINNSATPWKGKNVTNVSIDLFYSNEVQEVQNETGLVGWWNLNQNGTGANEIFDLSGNGNNGTINGNPIFLNETRCYPFEDGCWDFDGVDDFVDAGTNESLNFGTSTDFTLEAWVNPSSDNSNYRTIVNKWESDSPNQGYYLRLDITTGYVLFGIDDGDEQASAVETTINRFGNGWVHLVGTIDRDNATGMKLYVDGILVDTVDPTALESTLDTTDSFKIGRGTGALFPFDGTIDSVRIYNRSLSADEIKYNYFHANLSTFSSPITYSCQNQSLPGTSEARFILYNTSLTTIDTDFTPLFNSVSFDWSNVSGEVINVPEITLNAPTNNTVTTNTSILFNYTVFDDDLDLINVTLIIDGVINQTNTSIANGTTIVYNISLGVSERTLVWYVNATANESTTKSEIRTLNTTIAGEETLRWNWTSNKTGDNFERICFLLSNSEFCFNSTTSTGKLWKLVGGEVQLQNPSNVTMDGNVNITEELFVGGIASVFDLNIRSPGSLTFGDPGFATMSATDLSVFGLNRTIISTDGDFGIIRAANQTVGFGVQNFDNGSRSGVSLSLQTDGVTHLNILKQSGGNEIPYAGYIGNEEGDINLMTTNGSILFALYDNFPLLPDLSLDDPINKTVIMDINKNNISIFANNTLNSTIFYIDRSTRNIGINAINATHTLTVNGTTKLNGVLNINSNPIIEVGFLDFDNASVPASKEKRCYWDDDDKTIHCFTEVTNFTVDLSHKLIKRINNQLNKTINKCQATYINGAQGQRATVDLADNSQENSSAGTIGLMGHDCASTSNCYIVLKGEVDVCDTSSFVVGDTLYLGKGGNLTNIKPDTPDHLVVIGVVITSNANSGMISVDIKNGFEVDELHDVLIANISGGNLLVWNGTGNFWENTNTINNNLTINGNLDLTGNITLGDTITFKFGEIIDNLVDGWLRITGSLNVTGEIISSNVFIPQYIFSHTNETINLTTVNVWKNITFSQEVADIKFGIEHNHTLSNSRIFTINKSGIYDINYNFDVIDTSTSSTDVNVAGRVIYENGTEISGSVFETDITKKEIETEISHTFFARLNTGDKIIFQFIADDVDAEISTHGTFGDHADSSTIAIKKISNTT
jgi:hypothetical protein